MLTDEEIFARLAELEQRAKEDTTYYVYFNPLSGEVIHLRNYLHEGETDYPHIEILERKLKDLDPHQGINIDALQVIRKDGRFVVTRNHELIDLKIGSEFLIHRIPKIKNLDPSNYEYDLLIEQNKIDRTFKFKLSSAMKSQYLSTVRDERAIGLYLTNERDPNILKRSFQLNLYYLANSDIVENFNGSEGDLNDIFCARYFPKYLHVIVE
jgi:hypothetical protein